MIQKARQKKAIFAKKGAHVSPAPSNSDLEAAGPAPPALSTGTAPGGGTYSMGLATKLAQTKHRMQNTQVEDEAAAVPLRDFLNMSSIKLLLLTTLILHFANGGIFPLMLLVVNENNPKRDAMTFAGSVFAARMLFDFVGSSSYQWIKKQVGGAKVVMILAFLTTATVRALVILIFLRFGAQVTEYSGNGSGSMSIEENDALTENRYAYASTVVLEGIGTGWSMLGLMVLFEIAAQDTGRFGFSTSMLFAVMHLGAGLSVTIGGLIYDESQAAAFVVFAVVSLFAVAAFRPAYDAVMFQESNRAARKIQAGFRGYKARKQVKAMKAATAAEQGPLPALPSSTPRS